MVRRGRDRRRPENSDNQLVEAIPTAIGLNSSGVAEFWALIEGLKIAKRHEVDKVPLIMDSELVIQSMHNEVTPNQRSCRNSR